ncbi:uncharacterized protein EI90DRAFT_3011230 [Cantharellus anzutake]|uniref:uncharacterized protein n=1 Tax=Cantharellus anzutake TaxID=1750568 RepID=UPI0019085143|nr:uncharacterized protein EI90DRAFT_3011230 [Cantharellus anzutake]KAF8342744.1 hypothetical protein EI90DRAFT_3011230 [Cantharellus anzutake]
MPKRAASPTVANDVRVLAVYRPYPVYADLRFESKDAPDFVSWIAACLGDIKYLVAIGWKPNSGSIAIVEISRRFQQWANILGEHKWKDFLLHPDEAVTGRTSRIYFSSLADHRACEKSGWKFKYLDEAFIRTNVQLDLFRYPYPKSTWCPEPIVDQTNESVCRPLPESLFPGSAPKPKPVLVPGSLSWVQRAETGGTSRSHPKSQRVEPPLSPNLEKGTPTKPKPQVTSPSRSSSISSISGVTGLVQEFTIADTLSAYDVSSWDEFDDTTSTLFEKNPRPDIITNETTVVQPQPEENPQNLWEQDNLTERKVYDDLEVCPTHKVRCKPNICADFSDHMKRHGLDPKHFQLIGGPSNAYTLQREKELQKQQDGSREPANRRGRSRGRGRGRAMPRGPFANPW